MGAILSDQSYHLMTSLASRGSCRVLSRYTFLSAAALPSWLMPRQSRPTSYVSHLVHIAHRIERVMPLLDRGWRQGAPAAGLIAFQQKKSLDGIGMASSRRIYPTRLALATAH